MHIPRNVMIALSGYKVTNDITIYSYFGMIVLFQTLAYPFLLLQRRLEVRSKRVGFIPESTFKGLITCTKNLIKHEGFLSLYKGYPLHLFAVLLWMSALPTCTDIILEKMGGQ